MIICPFSFPAGETEREVTFQKDSELLSHEFRSVLHDVKSKTSAI